MDPDSFEGDNVVGYQTSDHAGKNWVCVSFGFSTVGAEEGTFKMKDISTDSFDENSDTLQLLEPELARTDKTYFCYEGDWYEDQEDWNDANDDTFDLGTGFLANLASGSVSLTSAGEVIKGPTELDLSGMNWVVLGNPLPRSVMISELEATNFDENSDTLQVLESELARTEKTYFCYDGDWYEDQEEWNEVTDDDKIEAGEAVLANVASGSVKITFPSAL